MSNQKTQPPTEKLDTSVKSDEAQEFPSLLPDEHQTTEECCKGDCKGDTSAPAKKLEQAPVIEIIDGNKYQAYREKMKLFGIFVCINVIFVVFVQCASSIAVQIVFLCYIIFSALPKFIFGSLLQKCKPHVRAPPVTKDKPDEEEGERTWHISSEMFKCPSCGGQCDGQNFCTECGQSIENEHPILLSVCLTVHHEDAEGIDGGIRSFEVSVLPFEPKYCQLIFIIDGRRDRNMQVDYQQLETATFIISRLSNCNRNDLYSDDDGVVRFKNGKGDPQILEDGMAKYEGTFESGMIWIILLKKKNGGKRHSHEIFFDYMDKGITRKTAKAIMFVDSDVEFAWEGNEYGLMNMYNGLLKRECIGGVCGEIEVSHWYQNPLTMCQYFEYKSNQFLAKTFENWFGMVTCLPGAFSMIRPQAMETVLNEYLATSFSIWEKNQLDLGEDRTLTTLLIEAGWDTGYITKSVAHTDAPISLVGLIKQRRRWINSTIVNMGLLLKRVRRPVVLPLLISLAIELLSSFMLPSGIVMLFIQIFSECGVTKSIVIGLLVLWTALLITFSLTSKLEDMEYWFQASTIIGGFLVFLMILGVVQNFAGFFDKHWMELVTMLSWVFIIVFAAVIHGQWFSVLNVIAPVVWFMLTPTMYVIIPIYAVCNFDDVSWGTRGGV
ncbi:chitin synthase, putative [Entamoeba invadens IP1]|uniref:chitin synthase n=1 Tax=Entamoeba invadens IP1 TaxID=370355 RepID=A0A0A1TVC7_ENTIV|nr:chitin synthase, putative [Entamoeba invadens IP1]ELP84317.1 chitin synthase, putative [Entamoeba invadens IP1]|eukprot:XP_004183663.1 chitin synthase, putative [Entamoeba invadens IP1]